MWKKNFQMRRLRTVSNGRSFELLTFMTAGNLFEQVVPTCAEQFSSIRVVDNFPVDIQTTECQPIVVVTLGMTHHQRFLLYRMPPTVVIVSLVLAWYCSVMVRSSPELTDTNRTDTRGSNMITTDSGSDVMHRVTRSDLRATLGNKLDPGFWPARGRRSNFEDMSPPFWANRWWFRKRCAQELLPYWTPGDPGKDKGKLSLQEPLYVEEPRFLLLDRRNEPNESPDMSQSATNQDDPFWVARGRRQHQTPPDSHDEDSMWPATGGRASMRRPLELMSADEPFWDASSPRLEKSFRETAEEPFWAAREKRSSFKFLDELRSRRSILSSVSRYDPCWAARGRRSTSEDSRNRRDFLESLYAEEPFWPARGRRSTNEDPRKRHDLLESSVEEPVWAAGDKKSALQGAENSRDRRELLKSVSDEEIFRTAREKRSAMRGDDETYERRGLLESVSADESVWAVRGKTPNLHGAQESRNKRGLSRSISAEQPFWAARERRNYDELQEKTDRRGGLLDSLSAEEPFWAARGRRGLLETLSAEEPFWAARGKKDSLRMTSPSPEDLLSQIRTREVPSKTDPWWPVRGKRMTDILSNPQDESFWRSLDSRTRNKTLNQSLTP